MQSVCAVVRGRSAGIWGDDNANNSVNGMEGVRLRGNGNSKPDVPDDT